MTWGEAVQDALILLIIAAILGFLIGYIIAYLKYRSRIEALEADIDGWKAKYAKLENSHIQMTNDLNASNARALSLQSTIDGMSTDCEKCNESKNRLATVNNEMEQLQSKYDYLLSEFDALKNKKIDTPLPVIEKSNPLVSETPQIKDTTFDRIGRASVDTKDDLKRISGVGPFIEKKLNKLGIYTFKQIANFDNEIIEEVTNAIQFFPGRIERDNWKGQAAVLMNE